MSKASEKHQPPIKLLMPLGGRTANVKMVSLSAVSLLPEFYQGSNSLNLLALDWCSQTPLGTVPAWMSPGCRCAIGSILDETIDIANCNEYDDGFETPHHI